MSSPDRRTVSACLIVRDERVHLPRALASVAFCDEIVVVDSGSTDGTQQLARDAGARVVENPWPGFGAQRNLAIDHATGDWILEVDADETITPELAAELLAFLRTPGPREAIDLLALPMRHRFLGGELEGSAQYPNYRTRMFRRGSYRHDEGRTVHEGLKPRAATLALRGDMTHELARSWHEALGDTWRYTRLEASQFAPAVTHRAAVLGVVLRPLAKTGYRLVVDGGWRDGWRGVAKIGLDAGSDSIVWLRILSRRGAPAGASRTDHFGEVMRPGGPIRILALATSPEGAQRAGAWLAEALVAGAGSDSELVAPGPLSERAGACFGRSVATGGPLSFARGIMGAAQVRTVDALLLADPGARRAFRLLPGRVRGSAAPITPDELPATAVARLTETLR